MADLNGISDGKNRAQRMSDWGSIHLIEFVEFYVRALMMEVSNSKTNVVLAI